MKIRTMTMIQRDSRDRVSSVKYEDRQCKPCGLAAEPAQYMFVALDHSQPHQGPQSAPTGGNRRVPVMNYGGRQLDEKEDETFNSRPCP